MSLSIQLLPKQWGVCWSILLAREQSYSHPHINSDSTTVLDCSNNKLQRASLHSIIQDCREIFTSLGRVSIMHIRRNFNRKAHFLVKLSKSLGDHQWFSHGQLCSLFNFPTSCNESVLTFKIMKAIFSLKKNMVQHVCTLEYTTNFT